MKIVCSYILTKKFILSSLRAKDYVLRLFFFLFFHLNGEGFVIRVV